MTQKTALLFAGQGAQFVGMGRDLAAQFPQAAALFDQSREILGFDLANVCFNGPEADLTNTENAQPGIFVTSWIAFQLLKERAPKLEFQATAGLSLGELTALAAAGSFSFEDGLKVARQRGRFMQEACENTRGAMAAVLGLDTQKILAQVCREADVEMANLNCPGQTVISGQTDKIAKACEMAKAKGAKRAVPLPVAGAYHSRLMATAQEKVRNMLANTPVQPATLAVISNVTAKPHGSPDEIRQRLVEQVVSPVRWEDSIRYLLENGFRRFIELGPGTALSGFLKRIDKTAEMLNVGDVPSLEKTVQILAGELKAGDEMPQLEKQVAVVTGAGRGIGRAIALKLAEAGADVACVSRTLENAEKVATDVRALGRKSWAHAVDVADASAVAAAGEKILAEAGKVDILVNNAGITRDGLLMRMSDEDWDAVLDTNLKGAFSFTKAFSRSFLKQRSGRVINISSVIGLMGNAGQCNYAASKAALIGFTKAVAREFGSRGVTVNAIAPGFIETDMTAVLTPEMKAELLKRIPLNSLGRADVAEVALFLAGPRARYITGQVLTVDGGMVM